jgi:hypothetical protein
MRNIVGNTVGASRWGLPYPVTLNPVLYLSKNNGNFDTSKVWDDTQGKYIEYINKWIDPYTGKEAVQSTGDYRPQLVEVDSKYQVKFDGVDDYLDVGTDLLSDNNSITINLLVNYLSFYENDPNSIISDIYDSNVRYAVGYEPRDPGIGGQGFFFGYYDTGWKVATGLSSPETDKWYNLTGVADSDNSKIKLYIDGVLIDSRDGTLPVDEGTSKVIGMKWSEGQFLDGYVDEITFYPYQLSQNQITNLYNYTKQLKGI